MSGVKGKSGRKREYLRLDVWLKFQEEWGSFLSNDMRHLKWKVNFLMATAGIIVGAVAASIIIDLIK